MRVRANAAAEPITPSVRRLQDVMTGNISGMAQLNCGRQWCSRCRESPGVVSILGQKCRRWFR